MDISSASSLQLLRSMWHTEATSRGYKEQKLSEETRLISGLVLYLFFYKIYCFKADAWFVVPQQLEVMQVE